MSITRKQYSNLLDLNALFTAINFSKYTHGKDYNNSHWNTSIGGFAAYNNVAGLKMGCSELQYPILTADNGILLSTHDAVNHVFGDNFVSIFYTGENGNVTPKTFHAASKRLTQYILINRPEDNNNESYAKDETPAEAFSDEVSAPADDTLEVYAPKPTAIPEEVCSYGDDVKYNSDPEEKYADAVKCSSSDAEVAYINHAPDINDIRSYANNIFNEQNVGKDYHTFCAFVNDHLLDLTQAVKQGITHNNAEFLIIQNDGSDLEKSIMFKVFNDYTLKGHDAYLNLEMTRLVFLVH